MNRNDVIDKLGLVPLNGEGGFVKELYRDFDGLDQKACTTIYYLVTPECFSCMHKLEENEIYYYHDGPALEMLLVYEDHSEIIRLGKDIMNGEYPQYLIPKGVYQGSHMLNNDGDYTLVSTVMSPGYNPNSFQVATYEQLKDRCLDKLDLLKLLTSTPKSE